MSKVGKLSIVVVLLTVVAAGMVWVIRDSNPDNVVHSDTGTFRLGKVNAESVMTSMNTQIPGKDVVGPTVRTLDSTPLEVENGLLKAGTKSDTELPLDVNVCLSTTVKYKSELIGDVSISIASECKNFLAGTLTMNIVGFVKEYTATTKSLYLDKYTFVNK